MWTKLDDTLYDNPKIVTAGNEAVGVYARALSYCSRHLTDGYVPAAIARQFAGSDEAILDALTDAELWVKKGERFHIPRYLEYNDSRAHYETTRKKRSESGRIGGIKSGETRRAKQSASGLLEAKTNPVPVPVPSRPERETLSNDEALSRSKGKRSPSTSVNRRKSREERKHSSPTTLTDAMGELKRAAERGGA
jgi:hypothetical protein